MWRDMLAATDTKFPHPALTPTADTANMNNWKRYCTLVVALPLASAQEAYAQSDARRRMVPPLIPLESLVSSPVAVDDAISPDGSSIAFLAQWRGRMNIHVRPVDGGPTRRVTSDSVRSIPAFRWSADGRWLLYLQDRGGDEQFHLFIRGARSVAPPRDLTPFRGVQVELLSLPRQAAELAVITLNRRNPELADAYRLNLRTGQLKLAAENPGEIIGYAATADGKVLIAQALDSLGHYSLLSRRTEQDVWRRVRTYAPDERITPLRFDSAGKWLYMLSNAGTDLMRLVLVNPEDGDETVVHADPLIEADADLPTFHDGTDRVLALSYNGDTLRTYPQFPDAAIALQRVRERGGGAVSITSVSRDRTRWVLSQSAPHLSFRTWLYDGRRRSLTLLHRARPALDRYALATMEPVRFTARDGLPLRGYLTRAAGDSSPRTPLVVLVHGGPWSRDVWDFQADVQMLANRGYSVLQVNYRGSTGFGKTFAAAARHEFARKMHTDLIDGVQWAVARGLADSTRVAIMGGSYGGYAALVGLTFTPRAFRCAVDYAGSSNLVTLLESFPPSWKPFLPRSWYPYVGDPRDSTSRVDLLARSPILRADSVIAPLLIFQGANDPRVTRAQSDSIATTLRRRGVPVTYLLSESEGHSFGEAETSLAVNRATELFLAGCLGGRAQPTVRPQILTTLQRMTVTAGDRK